MKTCRTMEIESEQCRCSSLVETLLPFPTLVTFVIRENVSQHGNKCRNRDAAVWLWHVAGILHLSFSSPRHLKSYSLSKHAGRRSLVVLVLLRFGSGKHHLQCPLVAPYSNPNDLITQIVVAAATSNCVLLMSKRISIEDRENLHRNILYASKTSLKYNGR
jgi:hypothetical protein